MDYIYRYSLLNKTEKSLYRAIYEGWTNLRESVELPQSVDIFSQDIEKIRDAVLYDNPSIFFIDSSRTLIERLKGICFLKAKFLYDIDEIIRLRTLIGRKAGEFRKFLGPEQEFEAKLRAVYTFLSRSVGYRNRGKEEDYSVIGALIDGKAVCEGFAKAFKLLCDEADIPSVVVIGEKHAWNIVCDTRLKRFYNIDFTADLPFIKSGSGLTPYFLVSDSFIRRSHEYERKDYPACHYTRAAGKKRLESVQDVRDVIKRGEASVLYSPAHTLSEKHFRDMLNRGMTATCRTSFSYVITARFAAIWNIN